MALPNVDIFDPMVSVHRWEQLATQQSINIYLTKQIDLNRKVLKETIQEQEKINGTASSELKTASENIKKLQDAVEKNKSAISDLQDAFTELDNGNNVFKSNVDMLLDNYQKSINGIQTVTDSLTTSTEKLWKEVNDLKGEFDKDKLDAAIAGYEGVLKDAKSYTDKVVADLTTKQDKLASDMTALQSKVEGDLSAETAARKSDIKTLTSEVQASLASQTATIETVTTNLNATSAATRQWVETELDRTGKRIDKLTTTVNSNQKANANTHTELRNLIKSEEERAKKEVSDTSDELKALITAAESTAKEDNKDLKDELTKCEGRVTSLETSDQKQWDTINGILNSQNRIDGDNRDLNAFIKTSVSELEAKLDSESSRVDEKFGLVEGRVATNESDIKTLNKTLEAQAKEIEENRKEIEARRKEIEDLEEELKESRKPATFAKISSDEEGSLKVPTEFGGVDLTIPSGGGKCTAIFHFNEGITGSYRDINGVERGIISGGSFDVIPNKANTSVFSGFILGLGQYLTKFELYYNAVTHIVALQVAKKVE